MQGARADDVASCPAHVHAGQEVCSVAALAAQVEVPSSSGRDGGGLGNAEFADGFLSRWRVCVNDDQPASAGDSNVGLGSARPNCFRNVWIGGSAALPPSKQGLLATRSNREHSKSKPSCLDRRCGSPVDGGVTLTLHCDRLHRSSASSPGPAGSTRLRVRPTPVRIYACSASCDGQYAPD